MTESRSNETPNQAAPAEPLPSITIFSPMFVDFSDEGRDEENYWYDTDHVGQRGAIPGFGDVARYQRLPTMVCGVTEVAPLRYINAYRIEDPSTVEAEPYLHSYTHLTPRSVRRTFPVTPPHFRDVWTLAHLAGGLTSDDGARTLLLVADEQAGPRDAGRALLRDVAVPAMLTLPGVLRAFVFERADVDVPLSNGLHAPRFLTAYVLSSPEAATRPEYGDRLSAIKTANAAHDDPLELAWLGLYDRRPRAWTTRPL